MIKYFTSTFFLFFFLKISFGSTHSNLPNYCEYYPAYINGEKLDGHLDDHTREHIKYTQCYDSKPIEYNLDELTKLVNKVELKTINNLTFQLERRLAAEAVKQVLDKKQEYMGIANRELVFDSSELLQCGKKHSHYWKDERSILGKISGEKQIYNPDIGTAIFNDSKKIQKSTNLEKQKDFMTLNIVNTIKAAALFEKNKDHYNIIAKIKQNSLIARNKCQRIKDKCRRETPIWKNTRHCSKAENDCLKQKDRVKEKQLKIMEERISPLYNMISTSPLLFDGADDGEMLSALNPFTSDKLKPSHLMSQIKSHIPKQMISDVGDLLSKQDENKIHRYFEENADFLNSIINNKQKYAAIQNQTDIELEKEFKRLNQAATELCEGQGKDLHHYPSLVQGALDQSYAKAKNDFDLKQKIAANQMAYCHMLRNKPLENNEMSTAAISGLAMLGVGAALQFIPVIGNIAGGALLTVGTGMAFTGGAVLATEGFKDTYDSNKKLNREIGLHSAGLVGYNKITESKNIADGNVYLSIANTALLPFDLMALRAAKKAQFEKSNKTFDPIAERNKKLKGDDVSRRYDFEKRENLDLIADDMGGMKQVKKVFKRYFPKNKYKIDQGDQIYIAAMAKDLEAEIGKELLKNGLKPKSRLFKEKLKNETLKVLDSIAEKCSKK